MQAAAVLSSSSPARPLPLALGTAQLGMAYGIANDHGKPDQVAATAMVATAWQYGVRIFDTAQAYGDSELVLGRALTGLGVHHQARVVSKLGHLPASLEDGRLRQMVRGSLARLGVPVLHGLLLHDASWLGRWRQGLGESLLDLRAEGLVERLGVSVYTPAEARQALKLPGLDLIQLPANLFDQTAIQAGIFEQASRQGVEIHVRSVFLQGLLLMAPARLPAPLRPARPLLERLGDLAHRLGVEQRLLALAFAWFVSRGGPLVVGAETVAQVRENCELALAVRELPQEQLAAWAGEVRRTLATNDPRIINPSLWRVEP